MNTLDPKHTYQKMKPARKRKRLSLSPKQKPKEKENEAPPDTRISRFDSLFASASDNKYEELAKGFVPTNTTKAMAWAVNNFEANATKCSVQPVTNNCAQKIC